MIATDLEKSYIYITDETYLDSVIKDLKTYKLLAFSNKRMKLAFDFETHWSDDCYKTDYEEAPCFIRTLDGGSEGLPRIFAIGLDPSITNRQYLIDTMAISPKVITEKFKYILEKESILIGQFTQYDLACLALIFNIYPEEIRDTMLIAQQRWAGDKLLNDNTNATYSLAALYNRCIPESVFRSLTGMSHQEYEKFKETLQKSNWSDKVLDPSQLRYSADDVRLIFFVYDALIKEVALFKKRYPKSGIIDLIRLEGETALECALMKIRGLGFDADYLKNELIPYLEKKKLEAEEKLIVIPECWIEVEGVLKCPKTNPHYEPKSIFAEMNSSKQCARVLSENLKIKLPKTDKGNDSVAGDTLNEILWDQLDPQSKSFSILDKIIQYRTACSYLSKYGYGMFDYIHEDGRVHPTYFQRGAETGRFSAKNPPIQTIPNADFLFQEIEASKLFRRCFISRPEFVQIDLDFSNEEVRVIGEMSGDIEIIRAFKNKEDLHQKTANNLGVDRKTGKLFFLASQYGAFEKKIKRSLYEDSEGKFNKTIEEVKLLRSKHFEFYWGLKKKIDECAAYVEKIFSTHDTLCDFAGRQEILVGFTPVHKAHRIWCLTKNQEITAHYNRKAGISGNPHKDRLHRNFKKILVDQEGRTKETTWDNEYNSRKNAIIREYFNFLVQAECAVVLKIAMVDISKQFREKGWNPLEEGIIAVIHDEILLEVRKEHAQEACEIAKNAMIKALETVLKKIPAVVEYGIGTNWVEANH